MYYYIVDLRAVSLKNEAMQACSEKKGRRRRRRRSDRVDCPLAEGRGRRHAGD